jgi:hypothetical protein
MGRCSGRYRDRHDGVRVERCDLSLEGDLTVRRVDELGHERPIRVGTVGDVETDPAAGTEVRRDEDAR